MANWYVRPLGGSYGSEDGTSYADAFDGFSDIVWANIVSNDTLYICGTHNESLNLNKDGTSTGQFIVRGDYPSDAGTINAGGSGKCINYVSSGDYIDFIGLTLTNPDTNCIYIGIGVGGLTPAHKMRFYDCIFTNSVAVALRIASTESIVNNCIFEDCLGGGIMAYSSANIVISNCTITNCGTAGANNTDGIGINDGCNGAIVRDCIVSGNKGSSGSGIDMQDSTSNSNTEYVLRCYVYNSEGHGISLGGEVPVYAINCICVNNTAGNFLSHSDISTYFYNCTAVGGAYGFKGGNITDSDATNATLKNFMSYNVTTNIFLNKLTSVIVSDYNCFEPTGNFQRYNGSGNDTYTFDQWKSTFGQDAHSIASDPLLQSDYRISKSSPCINAGTNLTEVTDDYWGTHRPAGANCDIGSHEYVSKYIKNATIYNAEI